MFSYNNNNKILLRLIRKDTLEDYLKCQMIVMMKNKNLNIKFYKDKHQNYHKLQFSKVMMTLKYPLAQINHISNIL